MSWFKLYNSFANHRKIKKIARELQCPQPHAAGYVITFLCEVSVQAPDGCLTGWELPDIEEAARWDGNPGDFLKALKEAGWIIDGETGPEVNDWMEYAEGFKRAENARKARESKHVNLFSKRVKNPEYSKNSASPLENDLQDSITPTYRRREERKETKETKETKENTTSFYLASASKNTWQPSVEEVWKVYCEEFAKLRVSQKRKAVTRKMWTSKSREYKAVVRALEAGKTPEQLCMAVRGMFVTPHNLGRNDRDQEYLGIHIAVREENVERFIANAEKPPREISALQRATEDYIAEIEEDANIFEATNIFEGKLL
jgi:hypothetical protein